MQELSLSELNIQIKKTLEGHLNTSYWIVAEISQLQVNSSNHCYLELVQKENNQIIAKAKAIIWSYSYHNISAWFARITGNDLAPGMRILANIKINYHEVYGLSLNIKDIDPSFTIGEREKAKQEIIAQLEEDGVIEMNRELELPLVPQNIAIISSSTAAGYEDFINQLNNSSLHFKVHCLLFEAIMQGNKAPDSIIKALHAVIKNNQIDAVVIIRGGGSQLDLDCFDNYELCSHIAQFPLPILTGIGHERDTSITDMVAHTQLKTPTAVAEFIIQKIGSYLVNIIDLFSVIGTIATNHIANEKKYLAQVLPKIVLRVTNHNHKNKTILNTLAESISHYSKFQLSINKNTLNSLKQKIELINPIQLLEKGYAIVYKNGKPLKKSIVKKGDSLKLITSTQYINSTVELVKKITKYE